MIRGIFLSYVSDDLRVRVFRQAAHGFIYFVAQLFSALFERQIHVRVKGAFDVGDHARRFFVAALLVGVYKAEHRRVVLAGIAEGAVGKRSDLGVVRPDMRFRIDHNRAVLLDTSLYTGVEAAVCFARIGQRDRAQRGIDSSQNGHRHVVGVDDERYPLRKAKDIRCERIAYRLRVVAVEVNAPFAKGLEFFSADSALVEMELDIEKRAGGRDDTVPKKAADCPEKAVSVVNIAFVDLARLDHRGRKLIVQLVAVVDDVSLVQTCSLPYTISAYVQYGHVGC